MQLNLRKYDLSSIKDDGTVLIIGKRGSGKSTILKNILYAKRHLPFGMACSGTEDGNGFFGKFMPSAFVHGEYNGEAIQRLIDRQKQLASQPGGAPKVYCILDDCLFEQGVLKRKEVRNLFMNGRHHKIFMACTAQFAGDIPTYARANVDVLFICRETVIANRKRLWEQFFGMLTFPEFCKLMDATTENYEVLVLDNTVQSNKPEDVIYWFKARLDLPDFKVGCKAFWRFSEQQQKKLQAGEAKAKAAASGSQATSKVTITIRKVQPKTAAGKSKSKKSVQTVGK